MNAHFGAVAGLEGHEAVDHRHRFGPGSAVFGKQPIVAAAVDQLQQHCGDDIAMIGFVNIRIVVKRRRHHQNYGIVSACFVVERIDRPVDHLFPKKRFIRPEIAAAFDDSGSDQVDQLIGPHIAVLHVFKGICHIRCRKVVDLYIERPVQEPYELHARNVSVGVERSPAVGKHLGIAVFRHGCGIPFAGHVNVVVFEIRLRSGCQRERRQQQGRADESCEYFIFHVKPPWNNFVLYPLTFHCPVRFPRIRSAMPEHTSFYGQEVKDLRPCR